MASTSEEMSASNKVLSTPELLEAILLKLPQHDVLLKQRVSKLWRNTVVSSPTMQLKLFYKSSARPAGGKPLLNPTIEHLLIDDDATCPYLQLHCKEHADTQCVDKCTSEDHFYIFPDLAARVDPNHLDGASCNSMLISDPTCPVIMMDTESGESYHSRSHAVKTVGDLLDGLERWYAYNLVDTEVWYRTA